MIVWPLLHLGSKASTKLLTIISKNSRALGVRVNPTKLKKHRAFFLSIVCSDRYGGFSS